MLSKIIKQADIDHFAKWFERAEKIVIVSHISPDGDAIGSSLGLWHFLSSQDKTANVIVPNAFPDFLKWMPGSKDILLYDKYKDFADRLIAEADVICCLDFNDIHRNIPKSHPRPNWCSASSAGWAISMKSPRREPSASIQA